MRKVFLSIGLVALLIGVAVTLVPPLLWGDHVDYSHVASIKDAREYQDPTLLEKAWALPVATLYHSDINFQTNASLSGPTSVVNVRRSLHRPGDQAIILQGTGISTVMGFLPGGVTFDQLVEIAKQKLGSKVSVLRGLDLASFRDLERAARLRFFTTASYTEEQIRHSVAVTADEVERINPQYLGRIMLNIGDTKTKFLLGLAKTPLLFYPHYKYHLPLPTVLMIENTNHCNAECVMCPRDTLSRKRGFMNFGLFEKIIKEASSESRKPVTHLHGFGEPLLDKLLPDKILLAKNYGITHTYIVSNASRLFPETSRKIISAGLDKMKISFYGTDEESYNNTMKRLDFKVTLQNIKDFLRIRKEMKSETPRLILQYLPNETNQAKVAEFRSLWDPLIDQQAGDCLNVASLHNYGGGRAYNRLGKKIVSVCYFPWTSMSVLWDGRVVTCCMDSNGVQVLGDLNIQTVQEVWNGSVLSGVRNDFGNLEYGKYPVCMSCDWVRRR